MHLSRALTILICSAAAGCGSSTAPKPADHGVFTASITGDWTLQLVGTSDFVMDLSDVQNQLPHFRVTGVDTSMGGAQPYTLTIERYGWRPAPGTYTLGTAASAFTGSVAGAAGGAVPITTGSMTISQSTNSRLVASFSFSAQRAASGTDPSVTLNVAGTYAAVCSANTATESCASGP